MSYFPRLFKFLKTEQKMRNNAVYRPTIGTQASVQVSGVMLFNDRRGVMFTANPVGARIWRGISDREEISSLVTAISREFDQPEERVALDTAAFLAELEAEGLVSRT